MDKSQHSPLSSPIEWLKETAALWISMNIAVLGAVILFVQMIDGYQQKKFEETFRENETADQA